MQKEFEISKCFTLFGIIGWLLYTLFIKSKTPTSLPLGGARGASDHFGGKVMPSITLGIALLARPIAIPRLANRRYFHPSPSYLRSSRNVLAKYTALPTKNLPILPQVPADLPPHEAKDDAAIFKTVATAPVASSFQETPPPDSQARSKLALPIPAMRPMVMLDDVRPLPKVVKPVNKEMRVEGVLIPAKPEPPGEEGKLSLQLLGSGIIGRANADIVECCMSGCVHCVYTVYADDLETYTSALSEAKEALVKSGRPISSWPETMRSMEKQGKSAGQVGKEAKADMLSNLDPSMAAFLA
jgi:hypothetical protein